MGDALNVATDTSTALPVQPISRRGAADSTWIAVARLHSSIGTVGVVGLLLLAAALIVSWGAWRDQQALARASATVETVPASAVAAVPASAPVVSAVAEIEAVRMPATAEVPRVLARIEKSAVTQGLGWPQADYRVNEATSQAPASLEVRCTLKGPYPAVRRFVASLLLDNPTLTLREFSVTRASSTASNVDAKLGIVVWLAPSGTSR